MALEDVCTGVDLLDVADVESSIADHGRRYLERVYTPAERDETADQPAALAVRFAAKEAVLKALGTDDAAIAWTDVEVTVGPTGRPVVNLTGAAAGLAARAGVESWAISVSCRSGLAAAVALGRGTQGTVG